MRTISKRVLLTLTGLMAALAIAATPASAGWQPFSTQATNQSGSLTLKFNDSSISAVCSPLTMTVTTAAFSSSYMSATNPSVGTCWGSPSTLSWSVTTSGTWEVLGIAPSAAVLYMPPSGLKVTVDVQGAGTCTITSTAEKQGAAGGTWNTGTLALSYDGMVKNVDDGTYACAALHSATGSQSKMLPLTIDDASFYNFSPTLELK